MGPSEQEAEARSEAEEIYTLYLTHYFWCTVDGRSRHVSEEEKIELTEADFQDGVCDLTRFAYDKEQFAVTEAAPLAIEDFDEGREGGAQITYTVNDGWKAVLTEDAVREGGKHREVFNGQFSDYEFVPADVVRIKMGYKYSNTGCLAGSDAAAPDTVEAIPEKQDDGRYKVEWTLPTVSGFRIVLDSVPLDQYLVKPPKGDETAAELEEAMKRGDFNVDIDSKTIYYYQEEEGQGTHPIYSNRYSTEYNQAWCRARTFTTDTYTATAVDGEARGANGAGAGPLVDPRLEVTLTEEQLQSILQNETELGITVYYRRNATWYTVSHWVPKALSGLSDFTGRDTKDVGGIEYVCMDRETMQGRVGAMTNAKAKVEGAYAVLIPTNFSQKFIENAASEEGDSNAVGTTVDIYYTAAESYSVIFYTNYTYIPRQQIDLNENVSFDGIINPMRVGYIFGGWQYLKKDAQPDQNGQYTADAYEKVEKGADGKYVLKIDSELISQKARLQEVGGVPVLQLYPIWEPATTQVRVILWTEDLTGTDDVQATAEGGNVGYYEDRYADYADAPVTHAPEPGESHSNYSNRGSFVMDNVVTDSLLVEEAGDSADLLDSIDAQIQEKFKVAMGTVNGVEAYQFYKYAGYEIIHEAGDSIDYSTTTAAADGKTTIYVYFTRNIYELQFHYYGRIDSLNSDYCVAINTNGYSRKQDFSSGFNFDTPGNRWKEADGINSESNMPVPQTITIKAKYGADLKNVWPVALAGETVMSGNQSVRLISWATTAGRLNATATNKNILEVYSYMGSEVIARPGDADVAHHMVAYWNQNIPSYYRYNHCLSVPGLDVKEEDIIKHLIYGQDTSNIKNVLYLVPVQKARFAYDFSDLMKVSYDVGTKAITYNDPNGEYYAMRRYKTGGQTRYFAITSQVGVISTNTIGNQNPTSRPHLARLTGTADHSTQYRDSNGSGTTAGSGVCGTADNPYDLYFYYDRNQYTITYMAPVNIESSKNHEVTLGTITLPYGTLVEQEKYGFKLDYQDTDQTKEEGKDKYPWTTTGDAVQVCPDRSEDGTAVWKFKGWGLGPAGVNMQWSMSEALGTRSQSRNNFAIESNLRLYAIWEHPSYTVTFHLNGGAVGGEQNVEVEVPASMRYSANGFIPRPVRDAHTLSGWYQADQDGNVTEPQTKFDFDKVITADQHVAAVWNAVSMEEYSYNVYYVARELNEGDKSQTFDTVQIDDENDRIVKNGGESYYVLEKSEQKNQRYIPGAMLNLTVKEKPGYIPLQTNKAVALKNAGETYNIIFYYEPIKKGSHVVRFVEAGTEKGNKPNIMKAIQTEADQTVAAPNATAVKGLADQGYELVRREPNGAYTAVKNYSDMTWVDEQGETHKVSTLSGKQIPSTVTYLVKPIQYTVTYENKADSPSAANAALDVVTAKEGTTVASAGSKNPTQYTTKDAFTAKTPGRVYEDGRWYKFSYWSMGNNTTVRNGGDVFPTLTVDKGTIGNLSFVANWEEMTDIGGLTVSKVVEGNDKDTDKGFHFTVTLSDTSINGIFDDMTFSNGVAVFTLKHGESITVKRIPDGTRYTVEESGYEGYTVMKSGDTGIIKSGETAVAEFTGYKNSSEDGDGGSYEPTPAPGSGEPDPAPGQPDKPIIPDQPDKPIISGQPDKPISPGQVQEPKSPDQEEQLNDSDSADGQTDQGTSVDLEQLSVTTSEAPKTSDGSNLPLWLFLMGASCIVAISAWAASRKKEAGHNLK